MDTIRIKNTNYYFQLGMYAINQVAIKNGVDNLNDAIAFDYIYDVIFEGFVFGHKLKKKPFKYANKKAEFIGIIDSDFQLATLLTGKFNEFINGIAGVEDEDDDGEDKKKSTEEE